MVIELGDAIYVLLMGIAAYIGFRYLGNRGAVIGTLGMFLVLTYFFNIQVFGLMLIVLIVVAAIIIYRYM